MLARFAPVISGPTLPPTPYSVWQCRHVFANTARPRFTSAPAAPRRVSFVFHSAMSALRSAGDSRTTPHNSAICLSMVASL